jgi:hypothetical protein
LAIHPRGRALYVGSAFNGRVTYIDLEGDRVERVDMPQVNGVRSSDDGARLISFAHAVRVTGDAAVSFDERYRGSSAVLDKAWEPA